MDFYLVLKSILRFSRRATVVLLPPQLASSCNPRHWYKFNRRRMTGGDYNDPHHCSHLCLPPTPPPPPYIKSPSPPPLLFDYLLPLFPLKYGASPTPWTTSLWVANPCPSLGRIHVYPPPRSLTWTPLFPSPFPLLSLWPTVNSDPFPDLATLPP